MLPGYNHNVKYKDRVYHVQTEDSGVDNPHVITHLFLGGNIIFSLKTSYTELLKSPTLTQQLEGMMQGQHKSMLKDLIKGRFDSDIAIRSVNAATLNGPAPLNVEAGAQHRASFALPQGGARRAAEAKGPPAKPAPSVAATPSPFETPAGGGLFGSPAPAGGGLFGSPAPAASAKVLEASALQAAFESKDDRAVDSIFGISEKSLDEVILSYLADDKR